MEIPHIISYSQYLTEERETLLANGWLHDFLSIPPFPDYLFNEENPWIDQVRADYKHPNPYIAIKQVKNLPSFQYLKWLKVLVKHYFLMLTFGYQTLNFFY